MKFHQTKSLLTYIREPLKSIQQYCHIPEVSHGADTVIEQRHPICKRRQ